MDQFEELFTLGAAEREQDRRGFIDALLHAATVVGGPVVVLLTMRVDFLGKCTAYPALASALSDGQELVGPMAEDELRSAIATPARLVGCEPEPGLTDLLLHDVRGQPGSLPLLQYTLLELWERRQGRRLTVEAYQRIGGVRGALERRADAALDGFGDAQREACRRIFLRLTQPGEGTEDTKRRVLLRELVGSEEDARSQMVRDVLRRLADARLITTAGRGTWPSAEGRRERETYIEVAHEALIRGWGRLRRWIEVDRASLRLHRRLTEATNDWIETGKDPGVLFRGARLAEVEDWARRHPEELNAPEGAFLVACRKLAEIESPHLSPDLFPAGLRVKKYRENTVLKVAARRNLALGCFSALVLCLLIFFISTILIIKIDPQGVTSSEVSSNAADPYTLILLVSIMGSLAVFVTKPTITFDLARKRYRSRISYINYIFHWGYKTVSLRDLLLTSHATRSGWVARLKFAGFVLVSAGPSRTAQDAKDLLRPFAYALNRALGIHDLHED